ncbi:MAG: hypothetical protein NTU47_01835 [Ignavibacteriales bacterium]|nr:hypothetical protein [Ignavibacteriales bacterium]
MKRTAYVLPFIIAFFASPLFAQGDLLTEIRRVGAYEVKNDGFVLESNQDITIHAVAATDRYRGVGTSAWILDKATRTVVWKLRSAKQHTRSRNLADYDDVVQLPKGEYEVYYAAYPEPSGGVESFSDFMELLSSKIFDGRSRGREYNDLSITVHGHGKAVGREGVDRWQQELKKTAVVSLTGVWDNDYVHQGFALEKPTEVTIYALGENQDESMDDYGWIINAKTGQRVWEMNDRNLKSAGGAGKNRMSRETLQLQAGQYVAYFVTDGSHSYREWNAPPPYDPSFWGLTVWVKDEAQRKYAKTFEYKPAEEKNVIADLNRLGDHESKSKPFSLKKGMDVRIYALGEGRDGEMSDYGWIVDASTRKKVWKMTFDETSHAGGDKKNRLVDKVIHLDKGSYVVHFVTDGSHSYHNWNSSSPFDPEHWGITLSAVGDPFDPNDVTAIEERANSPAVASILRVGNDERRRKEFTLSKTSDVHIYAVGEGRDGEMYDYAWIEDVNSGKTVWKMKYRSTDPAGGASKNRLFDGSISLQAGKYIVFYETDDTHAYGDWNDAPPDDPEGWGVTISLDKR